MSFSFSQSAGTSGVTTITVSATSRQELESLVENYTLSNGTKSLLMPIVQRAYVPTGKYISFKPSSFSFESSGGTGSLQVTSNDDWYINFGSWVYPNEVRGNGNTIVGIRVEANTGDTRSGSITGYCLSDSAQTASTSVSQVGSYVRPFLSVSPLKTAVNASGVTGFTLAVTSNQDWITYADARWVTMNTLSGSGDGSISFEVGENATDIVRESNIYVVSTASSLSATSVIVQSAQTQEEPYIIVSPTTKRIGTSGGSFTVTVSSNTEWETAVVYDGQVRAWISLDKLNGYGDDTVVVRIDPDLQESVSGRSAYISFYNTNENLKADVNIEQKEINTKKIYYTSTDENVITPKTSTGWGATLLSNTYENGLGVITFDNDVQSIPYGAFSGKTTLETIDLPESVTAINSYSFSLCQHLKGIEIKENVRVLQNSAFQYCYDMEYVDFNATDCWYSGNTLSVFQCCSSGGTGVVRIGNNVTKIPPYIFDGNMFGGALVIPSSVTKIGKFAFYCNFWTSLDIQGSPEIDMCAFMANEFGFTDPYTDTYHSGDTRYSLKGDLTLSGVTFTTTGSSVPPPRYFEHFAYNKGLDGDLVIIDSDVKGDQFKECTNLNSITVNGNVQNYLINYGDGMVGTKYGIIPQNVDYLGDAFADCTGLTQITIPSTVEDITGTAFSGCTSLRSVTFENGNNTLTIRGASFRDTSLVEIKSYRINCPTFDTYYGNPFSGTPDNGVLHYPSNGSGYSYWLSLLPSGWTAVADL